jgi:hypothetical protein
MENVNDKLISDFILKFEKDIEYKKKVNLSEEEQLDVILEVYSNYIKYFTDLSISSSTLIKGKHPHVVLDFNNINVDELVSLTEKTFMELGIRFKRHRFSGSLPLISGKNASVPGLLHGRGYFMFTFSEKFRSLGSSIKIECLRENQVVKVLDGKIDNLSLVFWNGRGMSRTYFDPLDEEQTKQALDLSDEENGIVSIEMISNRGAKNLKVKGDFSVTLNDQLILKRITSVDRG